MRVGGGSGATGELLVTGRPDNDGVRHRSRAAGIKRAHVEDVDTLHLSENFQTLQTSSLLKIGRDGSGLGTGTDEIVVGLDVC